MYSKSDFLPYKTYKTVNVIMGSRYCIHLWECYTENYSSVGSPHSDASMRVLRNSVGVTVLLALLKYPHHQNHDIYSLASISFEVELGSCLVKYGGLLNEQHVLLAVEPCISIPDVVYIYRSAWHITSTDIILIVVMTKNEFLHIFLIHEMEINYWYIMEAAHPALPAPQLLFP